MKVPLLIKNITQKETN